ncbi:MAG: double-transrane region domain protein [Gemmatimonadetes bacterium]|nr:double-transrane region domain protein [Gemmatimonadota bacterium]
MSFLAPLYLLLGAGAAIPLLLHLLRRNIATRVDFPAARYLQRAEQEHSRSLRLRNLLLMLLRVLLILAIALAAARPYLAGFGVGHGPTALAVVLDNSLSTTAVSGGSPMFAPLRDAARDMLRAATPTDRLWLVTADGRVRGGTREALVSELARVTPQQGAGDLPLALRRAAAAVQGSSLPSRAIAVATDGQRSAWTSASRVDVPVSVLVPIGAPPRNRAVLSVDADPARWTPRGAILARVDAKDSVDYRVLIGTRTLARGAIARGEPVQIHVSPPERGWQALRVELEPDDFVADDSRYAAVWLGPPPGVTADPSAGPFAATALGTLISDGRATAGKDARIAGADAVDALPALITPPADPVRLGAANRTLSRLGIPWKFGAVDASSTTVRGARLDGVTVATRYRLVRDGTAGSDTLAVAGGEPWIVAGPGYVLTASRLDPSATNLPVRAAFVPWLADMVGLRLGAPPGDVGAPIAATPGAPIRLPAGVDAIESAAGTRTSTSSERMNAPEERGVWFTLKGSRRTGAIVVNAPPEESSLDRLPAEALAPRLAGDKGRASSGSGAWVRQAFASQSRRPAVTPLLVLALLLLAAEAIAVRSSRSAAA